MNTQGIQYYRKEKCLTNDHRKNSPLFTYKTLKIHTIILYL